MERDTFILMLLSTGVILLAMATNPYTTFKLTRDDDYYASEQSSRNFEVEPFMLAIKESSGSAVLNHSPTSDNSKTVVLGSAPNQSWPKEEAATFTQISVAE